MSSPNKKRKETTKKPSLKQSPVVRPTPESTPNPSLPDDLVVSCLARVSRLYYPSLSLVSKSFRSLIASPELYETRSSLGRTESCLYVCLRFPPDPKPRWFTLCRKPDQALTNHTSKLKKKKKKKKSNGYVLAAIPNHQSPPTHWSGLVAVGSNMYNIGGAMYKVPLSSVSILDCRSNTWREAPSMLVERYAPAANVIDGKIYVAGGCEECKESNWMEVFDPKTQTWELVSGPGAEICGSRIHKSAGVDGMVFTFGNCNGLVYKTRDRRWERVGWEMDMGWPWFSYSVVANMLYYYYDVFKWYDTKVRVWRNVKGLEGLPKFAGYSCVKLADYGGKMAVLWDKYLPSSGYKKKTICCAVVSLERRNSEEVWGKVEWLDAVLTVPGSYEFVSVLAATV
uniref:F-box/kelch-repeat protein n=1 Tax=Noccaea caerulescens TaxID=107243 RepID=A0A1J3CIQ7_NOCCA